MAKKAEDLSVIAVNPGSLLFSGVMMLEYMGWKEAADLITLVYPEVVLDGIVTYDFARQIDGATEVSTSAFADALIERIEGGVDLDAKRKAQQAQLMKERKQREIRRLLQPMEEMLDSGRIPHTVGDLMTRSLVTVTDDETVENAMHVMTDNDISSVVVEADDQGQWGILTRRDIVGKIVRGGKNPATTKVRDIASRPIVSVPAETGIRDAANLLAEKNFSRLTAKRRAEPRPLTDNQAGCLRFVESGQGSQNSSSYLRRLPHIKKF